MKEGYFSVTLGWLTLIFAGTLPYLYSREIAGFVNVLFETSIWIHHNGSLDTE